MAQYSMPTYDETTNTSVASSATSVTLLAANPGRKRLIIHNNSTAILYVYLTSAGAAATTTTANSFQMATNTSIEIVGYRGIITGIWASANGSANMTEFK